MTHNQQSCNSVFSCDTQSAIPQFRTRFEKTKTKAQSPPRPALNKSRDVRFFSFRFSVVERRSLSLSLSRPCIRSRRRRRFHMVSLISFFDILLKKFRFSYGYRQRNHRRRHPYCAIFNHPPPHPHPPSSSPIHHPSHPPTTHPHPPSFTIPTTPPRPPLLRSRSHSRFRSPEEHTRRLRFPPRHSRSNHTHGVNGFRLRYREDR